MNANEFVQLDVRYRYECLQAGGKKLVTIHEQLYVIHLYHLDSFFVELRLDPIKYSIISIEPFSEDHPRYVQYMKRIDEAIHI